MHELNITLGQNGRIVIPVSVRKLLGLTEGQRFRIYLEDQKIVLEKTDDVIEKLKNHFSFIEESLSEELIQDRRKAAENENQ